MKHVTPAVLLLVAFLAAGLSSGCTAFGALVGTAADGRKDKVVKPAGDAKSIRTLEDGADVEIRLQDGTVARGRYRGLDWTLTENRLSRYKSTGRALARDLTLPAPGPGASLVLTGDRVAIGELVGYGPGFVVFCEQPEGPPTRVPLDHVLKLADAGGRNLTGPRLEEVLSNAPLPVLAGVRIEQPDRTAVIPYEDVEAVGRLARPRKGLKTGLIMGAILDALWVIAGLAGAFG